MREREREIQLVVGFDPYSCKITELQREREREIQLVVGFDPYSCKITELQREN